MYTVVYHALYTLSGVVAVVDRLTTPSCGRGAATIVNSCGVGSAVSVLVDDVIVGLETVQLYKTMSHTLDISIEFEHKSDNFRIGRICFG